MRDQDVRGLLLQRYYDRRREGALELDASEFGGALTGADIAHVSAQLLEHGLISGERIEFMESGLQGVLGRITARGVDVVEGGAAPPIAIHFVDKSVNVTASQGVIVGDSNTQTVHFQVEKLIQAIDRSHASEADKAEAKSRLRQFLELPVVSAIVGGAMGLFSGAAT